MSPISITSLYAVNININYSRGSIQVKACYNKPGLRVKPTAYFNRAPTAPPFWQANRTRSCKQSNRNGQKLADFSIQEGLTVTPTFRASRTSRSSHLHFLLFRAVLRSRLVMMEVALSANYSTRDRISRLSELTLLPGGIKYSDP